MYQGQQDLYCKCAKCGVYFKIGVKRRKYCTENCRMSAYYFRKKQEQEIADDARTA